MLIHSSFSFATDEYNVPVPISVLLAPLIRIAIRPLVHTIAPPPTLRSKRKQTMTIDFEVTSLVALTLGARSAAAIFRN